MTPAQASTQQCESARAFASFVGELGVSANAEYPGSSPGAALTGSEHDARLKSAEFEQLARIEALKQRVRCVTGEPNMTYGQSPESTLDEVEDFWRRVLEFEEAEGQESSLVKTRHLLLDRVGINPPAAGGLSDAEIKQHLSNLIEGLAHLRIFLQYTDHLSDRELYTLLLAHVLEEAVHDNSPDSHFNSTVDMSVLGLAENDDGSQIYLQYYADELIREQWAIDFPEDPLPPHEDPPYRRDSSLPKAE